MPTLSDLYVQYNVLAKKLNEIYNRVEEKKAAVNAFLEKENTSHRQHRLLNLGLVPMQESLEKATEKLSALKVKSLYLDKTSDPYLKLVEEQAKVEAIVTQKKTAIETTKAQITAIEKTSSWIKKDDPFSAQQRQGASETDMHSYMITVNEAVQMKLQMQKLQGAISSEVGNKLVGVTKDEKEAFETEKKAAVAWSMTHNSAIVQHVVRRGRELVDDIQHKLNTAYQKTPAAQAQAVFDTTKTKLGTTKEHFLDDTYQKTALPEAQKRVETAKERYENLRNQFLEMVTPERREKQNRYRSMLPEYIVNELPIDTYFKGNRAWGIGKTGTEEKLKNIQDFLQKPFSEDKNKNMATIKELLTNVGVHLSDKALDRVYNGAIKAQQLKAAEAEPPELRM